MKKAGISRLLTQNDARGFGAIEMTISGCGHELRERDGASHAANHIAAITATTSSAYIMNRTGRMFSIKGKMLEDGPGHRKPPLLLQPAAQDRCRRR